MSADRIAVSRSIAADPDELFALVSDPRTHVEIDGSEMLLSTDALEPTQQVGDTFIMHMDREPLGDIPLGKYTVRNHVTRFEPGSVFEWAPGGEEGPPLGHLYGYELSANDDGTTDVVLYCDWSDVAEEVTQFLTFPVVPPSMLETSLEALERRATNP